MGQFSIEWDFRFKRVIIAITMNEARMSFVHSRALTTLTSSVAGKLYWAWSRKRGVQLPTR
jgi:hypothetical protein